MTEPLATQNAAQINKMYLSIISVLVGIVVSIGVWGVNSIGDDFKNIRNDVQGVSGEVSQLRRDVQLLLLSGPRINEMERRIEQLESGLERHQDMPGHRQIVP